MKDILITACEGNVLELSTTPLILKRNESYRVVFDLTGWDGTRPVCRFRDAAGHYTDKELDSDNSCVVPALSTAITYIGLYSYDNLHSSTLVRLDALESILSDVGGASELLTNEEIETLKGLAGTDFSGVLSLESTLASAIDTYVTENKDTLKGDKGERGYSAFEIAQQNDSSVTDVSEWLASLKGVPGENGSSVTVETTDNGKAHTITLTDKDGDHVITVNDGEDGETGPEGSSVTVQIDDTVAGEHAIVFTDKRGNHLTTIYDGEKGADGSSVTVRTSDEDDEFAAFDDKSHVITFTDKNGDHTVTIYDGTDGTNGTNGTNGENGENGVSPTVEIDDTVSGQHTVTITDVDGVHDFTVYDGSNGTNGTDGTTPVKGIDYFTSAEIALIEETVLNNVIFAFETEVLDGEY